MLADEDIEDIDGEIENIDKILNPKDAINLLYRLYTNKDIYNKNEDGIHILQNILNNDLPNILSTLSMNQEMLNIFKRLPNISAATLEQKRLPMLKKKTLFGVGGAYSAGKSSFLNSITGIELPTDQDETTAVGTYLINDKNNNIIAFTSYGRSEKLTVENLQSITHGFNEKYGIGFADVLHKIIITSPNIPLDISLLDTPGYNKPENKNIEDSSKDYKIARKHLLGCDFIIWLIDASDVIKETDLIFLKELQLNNQCLIVFNKADMFDDKFLKDKIVDTTNRVKAYGVDCFGVTAYSSLEKKEYFSNNLLKNFLNKRVEKKKYNDIFFEIEEIKLLWRKEFKEQSQNLDEFLHDLQHSIALGSDIMYLQGLIKMYFILKKQAIDLYKKEQKFIKAIERIERILKEIME